MAEKKRFEIVHHSRTRRERTYSCDAIDCTNRVTRKGTLCADCEKKDDQMRREYALW